MRRTGAGRRALLAVALVALAGCAAPRPNPFTRYQGGPVRITVENRGDAAVSVTVLGGPEAIPLGVLLSRESQTFRLDWQGSGQIRIRLGRVGGIDTHETFSRRVEPGDRFLLVVGSDLRRAELIRR